MKKFLAFGLFLMSAFGAVAQLTQGSVASTNAPGGRIYFYQYKPPHYNNTEKFPLIISLHGGGQGGPSDGSNLVNTISYGLPQLVSTGAVLEFTWQGKTEGFVMLAPQTTSGIISGGWPTYYTNEMITYAIANLNADPDRIFLTGFSLGGLGVWQYATSSTANVSKLAGIIPAAAIAIGGANFCTIASSKVATWVQHAQADEYGGVSEAIAYTNAINACSPIIPAVDSIFPTGSHGIYMEKTYNVSNDWRYPNVFQWMLKVNRNLTPATNQNPVPVVAGASVINLTAPVIRRNLPVLDGTASYDVDDIVMDYLWEQTAGFPMLLPNSQNRQWPKVQIPAQIVGDYAVPVGTYQFTFRIKDYLTSKPGHTQFATKTINVVLPASGHAAPATDAGEDVILANGQLSLQRTGNATPIYGGNLASFNWRIVSSPPSSNPVLKTFNGSANYPGGDNNVMFTGMEVPGVYVFEFIATNNFGDIGTDQFTITRLGALPVLYS